jgi:hypothetical protein
MKLHFKWSRYIIAAIYGYITAGFTGWRTFALGVGAVIVTYSCLMIWSIWQPSEAREQD